MDNIINIENNCQTIDTFLLTNANLYSYGYKLNIPFFASTFHMNKTLDDSLKRLESISGPIVIQNGKIMSNNNVKLKQQFPCYILLWPSDGKSEIRTGQGFYYGAQFIMTAKHVLKDLKKFKIFVLFPTYENCVIFKCCNTLPYFPNRFFVNQDIALLQLQGCLDPLQNIKLEIGELYKNDLHFYTLKRGCFVKIRCCITKPNLNMENQMSANEFVISEAGKEGDSGSPVYSISGTCVGLYIGAFKEKNSPSEYGKILLFDRNVIKKKYHNFIFSVPKLLRLF